MIQQISGGYKMQLLETAIRDAETSVVELRQALLELGRMMGDEIRGRCSLSSKKVMTPLHLFFGGVQSKPDDGISVVISTKDDYVYFAKGIAEGWSSVYHGYIDFDGARGESVYNSPYRSISFPEIKSQLPIRRVIIAKSVIASGCTAITLAKTAITKYLPEELIIVAPFYSQQGIDELFAELRNAKIYVAFGPDELNQDGMLVPGVGNIDARVAGKTLQSEQPLN